MPQPVGRREFLRNTGLALAGATGGWAAANSAQVARGIEPITRNGTAKFKFSLAAYSYRNLLSGDSPSLTLSDFIIDCAKMGLEGTELTSYYFPKVVTEDYLRQLKHETFRLGLDVSGTAIANDLCYPPGEKRQQEIAHVKRWVDYAETLGAPVIRVYSGRPRDGQTEAEAHNLAVAGLEECCDYAGRHGVFLALENHGGLTTTLEGMLALVRDVKSPWFGVNLDTGNFRSSDPYADIEKTAPYALNVQVKVTIKPGEGPSQESDFNRLARILTESGYRGYIALEYEEKQDPRQACPKYIEELRQAFL